MREREGLIARIRQVRRVGAEADQAASPATSDTEQEELRALEARITHLEALLQALQDSVHRESTRQSKRISELEAQIHPAMMRKALSDDARERGL